MMCKYACNLPTRLRLSGRKYDCDWNAFHCARGKGHGSAFLQRISDPYIHAQCLSLGLNALSKGAIDSRKISHSCIENHFQCHLP